MSKTRFVLLISVLATAVITAGGLPDRALAQGADAPDEAAAKRGAVAGAGIGAVIAKPARAGAIANEEALGLWIDFNHYIRIIRPDLARDAATALLRSVADEQLLAIVESGEYSDFEERSLPLAAKFETVREAAEQLWDRIQAARIALSRDPQRIAADIEALAGTVRQRQNALQRLRSAGQFAAPQLLATLLDQKQSRLHPHVETALVALGRPLVYPLSEAVTQLEPVQMGQVARALTEIGYPRALPYLKQILEDQNTDPTARQIVQIAYDQLKDRLILREDASAAELFLTLGQNYYESGTEDELLPGFDVANEMGIVWVYGRRTGLVAVPVPAPIFADVLAMRAGRRALQLDQQLDPALSLWLTANLRRENRLPEGARDEVTDLPREPSYYARMAGPLRMHDVLDRALNDGDAGLALDAIDALAATAGTDALINRGGAIQPLVRAITYPDRQVRYEAAFVMTQTRPRSVFPGSEHVVTVLSEAVRQSDLHHALAIAPDRDVLNSLVASLTDWQYDVAAGQSLDELVDVINARPGFDLIIVQGTAEQVEQVYNQSRDNYKIASAPILGIVKPSDHNMMSVKYQGDRRLGTAVESDVPAELEQAVDAASRTAAGREFTVQQIASEYSLRALAALRQITLSENSVYNVMDAEPALIDALRDERESVVSSAGQVLELLDSQRAQLAMAEAALDQARSEQVTISLLDSLAESAMNFGNKLGQIQLDNLLELVRTSEAEIAHAAARAHGALTLPTSNVVEMLVE